MHRMEGRMEDGEQPRAWVVKRHLSPDALKEYVVRFGIARSQVIAITEPQDGMFSLIFEPTDAQQTQLEAEEGQVAETLDELFGAPVTPVQEPVRAAGAIVAVPVEPEIQAPVVPSTDPTPS
jgi:hypothetical protein